MSEPLEIILVEDEPPLDATRATALLFALALRRGRRLTLETEPS